MFFIKKFKYLISFIVCIIDLDLSVIAIVENIELSDGVTVGN